MLRQIKIENYKSVVSQTLQLGLFNVVIGANGCGKSNLLEAIALAGLSSSGALLPELFESRGIRLSDSRFMRSAFDEVDREYISVEVETADGNTAQYKIHYNTRLKPAQWEDENFLQVYNRQHVNGLKNFIIYSLEESALRSMDLMPSTVLGRTGKGLLPYLTKLSETPSGRQVLAEVKDNLQVIDWFEDLDMPESGLTQDSTLRLKDRYIDETLDFFDQRSANEAFLYLLFYFTLFISDETPSFFAIDNIESSLNPKLCRLVIARLAELAAKHGKQVVLTTHSPFVLDGLDEITDRKRLFVVSRNSDGYTVVNPIKENRSRTVPLSEAWLKGYIGGLPNNF